jgi:hypothetical protein
MILALAVLVVTIGMTRLLAVVRMHGSKGTSRPTSF